MKELTTITPDRALQYLIKSIETDPGLAETTKHKYISAVTRYTKAGYSILDAEQLRDYCLTVSDSTRSFLKAGIRKLALEIAHQAKSGATPDNIAKTTAIIYRSQALMESIKLSNKSGDTFHLWLTGKELKKLLALTRSNGNSLTEIRDRVALGLMSNGMLRRQEVVSLTFNDLKEREDYFLLDVIGKGNKNRQVKLSRELANDILALKEVLQSGKIIRPILKRKKQPKGYTKHDDLWIGKSITAHALYKLVIKYGKMIKKDLLPHDLRRTGAKIAFDNGIPIEQISLSLGHADLKTTLGYLGIERDWQVQPADVIPY